VKEVSRNVTAVQGDVANLGNLDRLFATVKAEKARIDILLPMPARTNLLLSGK